MRVQHSTQLYSVPVRMEYVQAVYDFSQALHSAPPIYRIDEFRASCKLDDVGFKVSVNIPRWMSKKKAKQIVAARMLDRLSTARIKFLLSDLFPRADKKAVIAMRERLSQMGFPCYSNATPHPRDVALYRVMYEGVVSITK